MANNYDEYNYEDSDVEKKAVAKKRLLIGLLIVIAIVLIIVLLKSCSGGTGGNKKPVTPVEPVKFNYTSTLLEAGKKYFEYNDYELPTSNGECATVELSVLISKGLVNESDFSKCDGTGTKVYVCKLDNGSYQWTPWLSCTDQNSENEYGDLNEGTISDLIVDESFVSFRFLPQKLNESSVTYGKIESYWKDEIPYETYKTISSTKKYRYRDLVYIWNLIVKTYYTSTGDKSSASEVKEYYTASPASGYTNKDNKTEEAYKWFTSTSEKVYLLESDGTKKVTETQVTPNASYPYYEYYNIYYYLTRTVKSTYLPTKYNKCTNPDNPGYTYLTPEACGTAPNTGYSVNAGSFWSCAINDETITAVPAGTVCKIYNEWKYSEKSCDTTSDLCDRRVKTYYLWYKLSGEEKTYYPSGSSSASGEKVYYVSAPVKGAQKDTSTKATAYKWYKQSTAQSSKYYAEAPEEGATKTDISKWTEWSDWKVKVPKSLTEGGTRKIESKYMIKLQEIKGTTGESWTDLSTEYVTEEEMITLFNNAGFKVTSLQDINNNGNIRYKIKLMIRNKKKEVTN